LVKAKESVTFTIQFVARISGVGIHTIRAWEKRYQAIVPKRDAKGRRHFDQGDIDRLIMLKSLVDLGNNISEVATLTNPDLKKTYEKFEREGKLIKLEFQESHDVKKILDRMISALQNYRLEQLSHELKVYKSELNYKEFAMQILWPLLQEVGRKVFDGSLGIAQEHALSAIIRHHVGEVMFQGVSAEKSNAPLFLLATPESELHEFGILMGALFCHYYGMRTLYLGANMPMQSLADAITQIRPEYTILGVSSAWGNSNRVNLDKYILGLYQQVSGKTSLLIGGHKSRNRQLQVEGIQFLENFDRLDYFLKQQRRFKN
jgi:DNA-binding transcriptional MerR regulator